jgi:hypothetical protein
VELPVDLLEVGDDEGVWLILFVFQEQLKFQPEIRKRINAVDCQPCIKFDPLKLWCKETNPMGENICSTYDKDNGILDFVDQQHFSAYGSIKYALFIRRLYEEYLEH